MVAGYDFWGFHRAEAFERDPENPATAVARHWSSLLAEHPSLAWLWPSLARQARFKQAEWTIKAADVQIASGSSAANLSDRLDQIKDQAPQLAPAIRKVEQARELVRHDERWKEVHAEALSLAAIDQPEKPLAALDAFLREFPETSHRAEVLSLARSLKNELATRRGAVERRAVDDLIRAETLPNASFADLIEKGRQFLSEHPDSVYRTEVQQRLDGYLTQLDERDIERARDYSRRNPTSFATRIERYQDYLKGHQTGGRFLSEAIEAKDLILREWDVYAYRQAYDHFIAHPDDVAEVARRLRDYLRDHHDGHFAADARGYLDWWDKVSVPGNLSSHTPPRRGRAQGGQVLLRRRARPGRRARSGRCDPWPVVRDSRHPSTRLGLHIPRPHRLEAGRSHHHPDHRLRLVGHRGLHPQQPPGRPPGHALALGNDQARQGGRDNPRVRV